MRSIPSLEHFLPTLVGHFAPKGRLSTDISLSAIQSGRLDGGVEIIPMPGEFSFGSLKLMWRMAHALSERVFISDLARNERNTFPSHTRILRTV